MGAADLFITTEEPQDTRIRPDLPGMVVNAEDSGSTIQKLVPGRFKHVRPLSEVSSDSKSNPMLVAEDTTDGSFVTLQHFSAGSAHARLRECQQRCCLRANDAPCSPTSGLTSPMSCPRGEPMVCDIYEIHGSKSSGWLAVMEMGSATLADSTTPLTTQKKRTVFLRVARAVQMLHSAGLIHNSIHIGNVIECSSGYKLGDFSCLQRHGEVANEEASVSVQLSPEFKRAKGSSKARKCDFATDVWCLGALLSELLFGELPEKAEQLCDLNQFDGASEEAVQLLTKMLHPEPNMRPVIDVVLQEAIKVLYVPEDDDAPHESLDFDSPVKDRRNMIIRDNLKSDDLEQSPLHSAKGSIDYCLAPPAHSDVCTTASAGEHERRGEVKRESQKNSEEKDTEGSTSSNCECRCSIQ